ncbi:MAG: hypothetical protein ACK5N8_05425 [Alphaproteobacteria bacterium]
MKKEIVVNKENIFFLFVFLFFSGLFIYGYLNPIDDCAEDTICKEGTELPFCPPCWKEPCVVTKELCQKVGALWNEEYKICNFNILTISKEYCEKSGGVMLSSSCNFDKFCNDK